jgi:hypothetical protein
MDASPRRTRLQRKQLLAASSSAPIAQTPAQVENTNSNTFEHITVLPDILPPALTKLPRGDHKLLLHKQSLLRESTIPVPSDFTAHSPDAVAATLVFAQPEAGTAVCVDPSGLLLTCSHCVAETASDLDPAKTHWLLFASGTIVAARCVAWDGRSDLALLRVIATQQGPCQTQDGGLSVSFSFLFPAVAVADRPPKLGAKLVCVGHPGSEDLEAARPGVRTGYDVLHLSEGRYRGCAEGQDPGDNSEIGALKHDCWTYWGHSGAPLLERSGGRLVGLHSSWDDDTGMRRGVPLETIREFLEKNMEHFSPQPELQKAVF